MPRKKKKDDEPKLTEAEKEFLTDEEKAAIEAEPEETDEPEGKKGEPEEEGKPEETPPEKPAEEKPEEKGEGKGEEPPEKPLEGPVDLKEGQKINFIIDGKTVEGTYLPKSGRIFFGADQQWVQSKDGQGIIPFAKLEEERQKVSQLQARVTAMENAIKARPKPEEIPTVDLEKLEAEFYDTENPKEFIQKIMGLRQEPKPEQEPKELTPEEITANAERQVALDTGMKKIIEEFPILNGEHESYRGDDASYLWTMLGTKVLMEKVDEMTKGVTDEAQKKAIAQAWTGNVENLLTSAREAAERTKNLIGSGGQTIDEEALRKTIREEEFKRIKTALNLSEKDVRTLGDIRDGSGQTATSMAAELDGKSAIELEEAIADMSPEKREQYENAPVTET